MMLGSFGRISHYTSPPPPRRAPNVERNKSTRDLSSKSIIILLYMIISAKVRVGRSEGIGDIGLEVESVKTAFTVDRVASTARRKLRRRSTRVRGAVAPGSVVGETAGLGKAQRDLRRPWHRDKARVSWKRGGERDPAIAPF
ncbi:unnamed protein product [Leptosia nina]|uniref:Uncharacterized protein n=1 Tax=Leptosia nina TaxID=320188 RepID=A0AAV1JQ89_9NEOP